MQKTNTSLFWMQFKKMPLIGIARNIPKDTLLSILPHYAEAGLINIEVTMNSPGAEEEIRETVKEFGTVLNIGAGTVCSIADLEKALNAGATFIVTPIVDVKVIQACRQRTIPLFTGAYTPTEIYKAMHAGCDAVKLFPSSSMTVEFIKDLLGPFPDAKLIPTGGVDVNNAVSFLNAGAAGVGMGSQLFYTEYIKKKNFKALSGHFKMIADRIASSGK